MLGSSATSTSTARNVATVSTIMTPVLVAKSTRGDTATTWNRSSQLGSARGKVHHRGMQAALSHKEEEEHQPIRIIWPMATTQPIMQEEEVELELPFLEVEFD